MALALLLPSFPPHLESRGRREEEDSGPLLSHSHRFRLTHPRSAPSCCPFPHPLLTPRLLRPPSRHSPVEVPPPMSPPRQTDHPESHTGHTHIPGGHRSPPPCASNGRRRPAPPTQRRGRARRCCRSQGKLGTSRHTRTPLSTFPVLTSSPRVPSSVRSSSSPVPTLSPPFRSSELIVDNPPDRHAEQEKG